LPILLTITHTHTQELHDAISIKHNVWELIAREAYLTI
jgi:hypothetical protein